MEDLDKLSNLSRELSLSSLQQSPEDYIKQTLLAHGFFSHSNSKPPDAEELNGHASTRSREKLGSGITEDDKKRTTQLVSHVKEGKEVHRLKEPRSLFNKPVARGNSEPGKQLPFWPIEVECVSRRPKFIGSPPPCSEPFYVAERDVISPKIRSVDGIGTNVYIRPRGPEKYFTVSRAGPSRSVKSSTSRSMEDTTLLFESRFESGNLGKAVQVGKWDYELYLSFDLYTNKHTQWYYFSVRNMNKGQTYRFTIVNLYKAGSLYNEGMQPVTYSTVEAKTSGVGWRRMGHNIKYFKTPVRRQDTKAEAYYFGLTWSHTFEHEDDTCYFAHCYPYTYSDMQDSLQKIAASPTKAAYCKQRVLCKTMAGNPVPLLTITSPTKSPQENLAKRAVVITSRVHPGETNGSWMMKGLLDFLTGESADAMTLRDSFVFKIIPMLNPDGVIVGNYRCSLSGRDLNRNYRTKLKDSYPTVWHTKAMVKRLIAERDVVLFCDLHGHSRKHNVFIYGCDSMDNHSTRLRARIFPKMLSKNAVDMFSFKSSRFGVSKSKEGTGRVVMWREMGIMNSYTMEATFCGSQLGAMAGKQFRCVDLEKMGYQLCDTILDYCDPDQSKVEHILRELEEDYRACVLSHLASIGQEVPPGVDPLDIQLPNQIIEESSDAGSDSSDSDGPPVHYLAKECKRKKKKLKSRRERNKRKAILKLSHHSNSNKPTPSHNTNQIQFVPPLVSHAPASHEEKKGGSSLSLTVLSENSKNNGIPMFVQERLDERNSRKKSDTESTEDLYLAVARPIDHIEAIAMDYLKQGIPPHLGEVDPRSSMNSFPRPTTDCPINITPMSLCEGGRGTRPPSRASSRTSLPQLIDHRSHGNHGAFTSHYLANHLQDIMSTPTPPHPPPSSQPLPLDHTPPTTITAGTGNTAGTSISSSSVITAGPGNSARNLANLSRLFRQLRPHLINTERQTQKKKAQEPVPEKVSVTQDSLKNTGKVEFHTFSNISQAESIRQLQMRDKGAHLVKNHSDVDITIDSSTQPQTQDNNSHTNPSPLAVADPSPLPPSSVKGSTDHVSSDHVSSHSSLGERTASSATTSWENIVKPVKPVEKQASADISTPDHPPPDPPHQTRTHRDRRKTLSPLTKSSSSSSSNHKLRPASSQLTPTSQRASRRPAAAAVAPQDSVIEHKRNVSEAVDLLNYDKKRKRRKKVYRDDRHFDCEDLTTLKPTGPVQRFTDHTPFTARPHPLITDADLGGTATTNNVNIANSSKGGSIYADVSTKVYAEVTKSQYSRGRLASALVGVAREVGVPDEDHEYFSELVDNINKKRHYPVTRMVSSKPASRGGTTKPAGIDKSLASVNMAFKTISSHEQPRPSTTSYSFRKPRPLFSRSHSRNSSSLS